MRQRQWGMLLFTGIIGGILSGIVKLGWEVMFPPRTPERNATNPPQNCYNKWDSVMISHIKLIHFRIWTCRG